jgi:pimeloyl-ACP methyl ester carboxylesterase
VASDPAAVGMGGEISVFEEDQLEKDLEFLSKDESLTELFNRSLSDMTSVLTKPKRFQYDSTWLHHNACQNFQPKEYELIHDQVSFHCVKWSRPDQEPAAMTIIYLPTNGRAAPDAIEILPLCEILNADLFTFDCRGCGKSSGQFSLTNAADLDFMISHHLQTIAAATTPTTTALTLNHELILWGRGMGTNSVIEYLNYSNRSPSVKFIVLDSPFTALHAIVHHAASSIDSTKVGLTSIPSVFIKFALYMMRKSAQTQLGIDPYLIRPITLVNSITLPSYVLSADEDDYIPDSMGKEIAESWAGKCWYRIFPGKHVGERDPGVVMSTLDKILPYVATSAHLIANIATNDESALPPASSLSRMTLSDPRQSSIAIATSMSTPTMPLWKADSSAGSCEICHVDFDLVNRRHHCRHCGSIFCHSCSTKKLKFGEWKQAVRVCDICHDGLTCQWK